MAKAKTQQNLIVLVGAGYANIEVLRKHARNPFPNSEVLLITPRPTKLNRSMLPWVISGEILRQNAEIDLLQLCKVAKAQLMLDEVERVDLVQKSVILKNGGSVYFDFLSLSLGTDTKTKIHGPQVVSGNRLEYLSDVLDKVLGKKEVPKISIFGDSPLSRLFIRGIGRLKTPVELTLLSESDTYLKGIASLERLRINAKIKALTAKVLTNISLKKNAGGKIHLESGDSIDTDLLILSDEGSLSPVFSRSGFPTKDEKVMVNDALQLTNCRQVYVAGPGVMVQRHIVGHHPHRPSHYFGKIIAENLRRELLNKPLVVFRSEHAIASWLPSAPETLSLGWHRITTKRWKNWIKRRRPRASNSFLCASAGELLRSDKNDSLTLICSRARLAGAEPQWVAQVTGRQILHQCQLKKIGLPSALQADISLRTFDSSKKMIRTKVSQIQAGLESLNLSSLEVRVSSSVDESMHLSSELAYQPNLKLKPGDLVCLVGKLGSVQSLYWAFEEAAQGEAWYELRNEFNQNYHDLIETAVTGGSLDGCALDERGLIRNLEDLVVPNNLGVSMDLDRIPIQSIEQKLAVDPLSPHIHQNLEYAKYLPNDYQPLMHHPRFLALFGAEVSGLLVVLPKNEARNISEELATKFPNCTITPIGALTEGPVRFKFRLTTHKIAPRGRRFFILLE